METTLWLKTSFSTDSIPDWPCPTCHKALLTLNKKEFKFEEPRDSKIEHRHSDWDPEWIVYRFVGILRCSNKKCQEMVMVIGNGGVEFNSYHDPEGEGFDRYEKYFEPKYFLPPLHLFKTGQDLPKNIEAQVIEAFNLYWCDLTACANKIRIALEMIMDHQGIKKTTINKKRERVDISLHARIELLSKKRADLRDHLIAIKWIGNSGSHVGKLERVDLIDAFSLLEYCIEKLYDKKETTLRKISKQIVKTKKPRYSR